MKLDMALNKETKPARCFSLKLFNSKDEYFKILLIFLSLDTYYSMP